MPLAEKLHAIRIESSDATAPTPCSARRSEEKGCRHDCVRVSPSRRILSRAARGRVWIRPDLHQQAGAGNSESDGNPAMGNSRHAKNAVSPDGPPDGELGHGK